MYSTCLFCHRPLGANESIEHFPVGKRLAFDAAKGRLWVVCRSCERWNLTPIEERWEAIEECEREFSRTKLRVSTDEIGLARLRDRTTLIRIGQPQRPEMAAWRYGDQFGRRRRRYLVAGGAAVAAIGGLIIAGPVMGVIGAGAVNIVNFGNMLRAFRTVARVNADGRTLSLNQRALNTVELRPYRAAGFELEVPFGYPWKHRARLFGFGAGGRSVFGTTQGSVTLRGDEALHAARVLLPRINVSGGNPAAVNDALALIERDPAPHALFSRMASVTDRSHRIFFTQGARPLGRTEPAYRLGGLSPAQRLALEMCLHEDDERRALEGELAELEQRWKEAEEIAAISDNLFTPKEISDRVERLKDSESSS
jgi:hypothetical protein